MRIGDLPITCLLYTSYGWVWSEGGSGGPWKGAVSTITELPRFWKKNAAASNLCYYLSLLATEVLVAGSISDSSFDGKKGKVVLEVEITEDDTDPLLGEVVDLVRGKSTLFSSCFQPLDQGYVEYVSQVAQRRSPC